jgi:tRNA G18 (ribose-2'-O)-methylase SpoU
MEAERPDPGGSPRPESLGTGERGLRERGLLVLEGAFLVERGFAAGLDFAALFCVPARREWAEAQAEGRLAVETMPEPELAAVAGYPFHRGVIGFARRPAPLSASELAESLRARESATVLVMPEIVDPENLGAAVRSAAAFGCDAFLLGPSGPDPLSRRALRVSMGASLSLPWARAEGPAELTAFCDAGFTGAACVLDPGATPLSSYTRPARLALVLGNEATGLSLPWRDACRDSITLPMRGTTDSLNLAAAAAVFLYALRPN